MKIKRGSANAPIIILCDEMNQLVEKNIEMQA
jgi:hypothetical protein